MTLSTTGYAVGNNMPLNHARILWDSIEGTVAAGGSGGNLATNDFTFQRWAVGALPATWTITTAADEEVDTVFIAAHNLGGTATTVEVQTAATVGGPYITRATLVPADNSAIAVMFNNNGAPYVVREVRISLTGVTSDLEIGIIRAGKALQMERPVYGGVMPIGLARLVETRHAISETGQWLSRTIQRQARRTSMNWKHLSSAWYRQSFEPFSLSLPQTPFGLIQNPLRMPESVAWCWTEQTPMPENMGIRDYMSVSLEITGFLE